MKKRTLLLALALLTFAVAALLGCASTTENKDAKQTPQEIKIGATAGPHAEVVEAVAKEAKKQGLNITLVEFSDYITPDKALADGEIDLNSYQHAPFLQNFNTQNKSDLVPIGKTILMRMGVYSDKHKSIAELPVGATIAIPNDPTNGGRGLVLLEKAGLIKLKVGVGFNATVADVVENPKNIQFQELEAAQLPRSISDVDAATITMNYVMSAGLDVEKQGIFLEPKDEPLAVMILAARNQDKDNETYKKIAALYQSDGVKQFIKEKFKGTIVPAE
ncbi:MAG TPA: MetQ/NlpA family ABC transporter substrate-binding protein [Candidatus Avacidaminococcus intestinavium]|uniref:Lipoprotein n=1 Tax=Candidatus Avacidaminococcus intestinavium TaxID=2840684 RepID=A0A9D1SKV8_9FIRM|nr:MetQ/NlpA family ABC transporter substrate-binding protein [Candidatus Avacidaminococcus intestinavium]